MKYVCEICGSSRVEVTRIDIHSAVGISASDAQVEKAEYLLNSALTYEWEASAYYCLDCEDNVKIKEVKDDIQGC